MYIITDKIYVTLDSIKNAEETVLGMKNCFGLR
jgi:hypothetical protein